MNEQMELAKNVTIRNFETDLNGKCSFPVIADLFQGIAEEHAGRLGFGYSDMIKNRQAWVLSRMLIEIHDFPVVGEQLELKTWPKRTEKLFALRDYTLCSENSAQKNTRVAATSAWIIINTDTRRPVKPDTVFSRFNGFNTDNAIEEVPGKVPAPEKTEITDVRRVRYTDIDINNHMNNSHYIRWALDMFHEDVFMKKTVKSLLINYTSELVFNDEVQLSAGKSGEDSWIVRGEKDGTQVFAAKIVWQ